MNLPRKIALASWPLGARRPALWAAIAVLCAAPPAHADPLMAASVVRRADTIHGETPNISARAILTSINAYLHVKQQQLTDKLTGHTCCGEHGYSLRLHGLEPRFNSTAYSRTIVIHGAC